MNGFCNPLTTLYKKPILNRMKFEAADIDHRDIVKKYLEDNKWENGCPFFLEEPYTNIHTMIVEKLAKYVCKVK